MPRSARATLNRLERLAHQFGAGLADDKRALVRELAGRTLSCAADVARLHERLLFLRAYPDDPRLLADVEAALADFPGRDDVQRFSEALADSGIAGTPIHFPFHWVTARWLVSHWPDEVSIDWSELEDHPGFSAILHLLLPYSEMQDLDALHLTPQEWVQRLKGPDETDAAFLVRRFEATAMDPGIREALFELLGAPLRVDPGAGTPSRTGACYRRAPRLFVTEPPSRERPDLAVALAEPPRSVKTVGLRQARELIHLAREAMVTRSRDLEGIIYASDDDVRLIDAGDGLTLVAIGLAPGYRALVETIYVFILLKNGVPVGYYQAALLFGSAEVNFNVFEPYRGTEAAPLYARCLAVVRHLFGVDTFGIEPYQLGEDNEEAVASGAFWFYYKLGYRPDRPKVQRRVRAELKKMATKPSYRSSPAILRELATGYLYYVVDSPRDDVVGKVQLARLGLAISDHLSERFGADREEALSRCSAEVRRLVGLRSLSSLTADERMVFERWAPLILALPGVARWPKADRRRLLALIRAKAAASEQGYATKLTQHRRLRRALVKLAAQTA